MIAYLKGRVGETLENACVLITEGGVGYEVFLPVHTLAAAPPKGEEFELYVCTVVREDALELAQEAFARAARELRMARRWRRAGRIQCPAGA